MHIFGLSKALMTASLISLERTKALKILNFIGSFWRWVNKFYSTFGIYELTISESDWIGVEVSLLSTIYFPLLAVDADSGSTLPLYKFTWTISYGEETKDSFNY